MGERFNTAESKAPLSGEAHVPEQAVQAQSAPFVPAEGTPVTGYKDSGWSWGGFLFNIMFAVAARRYIYLLLIIPMLVPFLNFLAIPAVMIFFGIQGRQMAAESSTFANKEQYLGFMKGVDHAGKVFFWSYLIVIMVGMSASVILAALSSARDHAREANESFKVQEVLQQEPEREYGYDEYGY